VVVNVEGEILYYSPRTGKYLEPAAGAPNRQLLSMARSGLRLDLRAALQEAVQSGRPVTRERVRVEIDQEVQLVSVTVEPLGENDGDPLYLVVFVDGGPASAADANELRAADHESY